MIPFVDLVTQHQALKSELLKAAERVLDSCEFSLGPEVTAFEEEFAAYCHVKHTIAVNTGTSALHLALLACGVGPGNEVITVPNTFIATVEAIRYTGAKPVLVDVDPVSYNMNPALIEPAITARTKAIVPVHLYGQTADMDPIMALARDRNLFVIEDACQAHGARYKGRPAGSSGHIAAFSFYPGKNLGACGEGGAVVTNDPEMAAKVRQLRNWGRSDKHQHILNGFNYRMDNLQGAFLRVKLRCLPEWTEQRRAAAAQYDKSLQAADVIRPTEMAYGRHVYHLYAILTKHRDALRRALSDRGIATGLHYPTPIHLHPCLADLGYQRGDFPIAERVADNELSLPMFPGITPEQVRQVAREITEYLKQQHVKT